MNKRILPKLLINHCVICGKEIEDKEEPICLNCFLHYEDILVEADLLYCCSCLNDFFYCKTCQKRLTKIHDFLDSYADYYLIGLKNDSAWDEYYFIINSNNDDYLLHDDEVEKLYDKNEIEYVKLEGIEKVLILKRIELFWIKILDGNVEERIILIKDAYLQRINFLVVYKLLLTPKKTK